MVSSEDVSDDLNFTLERLARSRTEVGRDAPQALGVVLYFDHFTLHHLPGVDLLANDGPRAVLDNPGSVRVAKMVIKKLIRKKVRKGLLYAIHRYLFVCFNVKNSSCFPHIGTGQQLCEYLARKIAAAGNLPREEI